MLRSWKPMPSRSLMTKRNMIGGPQTKAIVFSTGTVDAGLFEQAADHADVASPVRRQSGPR